MGGVKGGVKGGLGRRRRTAAKLEDHEALGAVCAEASLDGVLPLLVAARL